MDRLFVLCEPRAAPGGTNTVDAWRAIDAYLEQRPEEFGICGGEKKILGSVRLSQLNLSICQTDTRVLGSVARP
jgi:hypothetical protein